jgi:phosphate transport system substrate-binding protein
MPTAIGTSDDREKARAASHALANAEVFATAGAGETRRLSWGVSTLLALGLLATLGLFWWLLLSGRPVRAGAVAAGGPSLRLSGSTTLGVTLAPALAEGFLESLGATAVRRATGPDGTVRVVGTLPGETAAREIVIRGGGSSEAFADLAGGTADVGLATRPARAGELDRLPGLDAAGAERVVGLDGLAVVVNPYNSLRSLTLAELRDVWSGRVRDWSEVGGSQGPIHLYAPAEGAGSSEMLQQVLGERRLPLTARRMAEGKELSAAVASDLQGVSLVALPFVGDNRVVALAGEGAPPVAPTALAVRTEEYPLSRRLYLYASPASQNPWVGKLLAYALSDAGQKQVEEAGFVGQALSAATLGTATELPVGIELPPSYAQRAAGAVRIPLDFRFRTGSDDLDSKAQADVGRLVGLLGDASLAGRRLLLFGFTDTVGDDAANLDLSRQRAVAVGRKLQEKIAAAALTEGFGEALPVASNGDEAGRGKNRRVEVWLAPAAPVAAAVPVPPSPTPAR